MFVIRRAVLAVVGVLGLLVAAVALPASAQTAPPPTIDRTTPRCADSGSVTATAGGTSSWSTLDLTVHSPTGAEVGRQQVFADGRWGGTVTFTIREGGEYEVRATDRNGTASSYIQVPCRAPTLEYDPPCFPAGYVGRVTMTGRYFRQFEAGHLIEFDVGGAAFQSQGATADSRGVVRASFSVRPASRAHPGRARDANGGLVATSTWNVCPPPTTSSTSTSTSVPDDTTTTAPPDDPAPDDTTTSTSTPPDAPGVPVTIPPTIDLPPSTPGATLTVTPELGPAGFVTSVSGTGFPPGAVTIMWAPGIGTTTSIVGPDGAFTARMLVFPNDRLGPRAIIASGGGTTAFDAFLVVQSTVQPSGQNVQQINRLRRFNQR